MRLFWAVACAALANLFPSVAHAAFDCQPLLEAFAGKIDVRPLAETVVAGDSLQATLAWKQPDAAVLAAIDELELMPAFSNRILGSSEPVASYFVKSQGAIRPTSAMVAFPVSSAMAGLYELKGVYLFARSGDRLLCYSYLMADRNTAPQFLVENVLKQVDVYPPDLTQLRFVPATAKPGETVQLVFSAADKNAICTQELVASGTCVAKWHQTLAGEVRWLAFAAPLVAVGGGDYAFSFTVPPGTDPGKYRVSQVFVNDVVGNYVETPVGELPELTVSAP
jgi:hypothetical protein